MMTAQAVSTFADSVLNLGQSALSEAERILSETQAGASWSDAVRACDHGPKRLPAFVATRIPWRKVRSLPVRADVRAEALADLVADLAAILPVLDRYAEQASTDAAVRAGSFPGANAVWAAFQRNRATDATIGGRQ